MSLDDLRKHGILLPEAEWGQHRLETTVAEGPMAAAFGMALAAVTAIYLGGGGPWTWVGLVVFLVTLLAIIVICDRAIERLRARTRRERRALHHGIGDERLTAGPDEG